MATVRLHFVVIFFEVKFDKTLKVSMLYLVQFYTINICAHFCEKFEGQELKKRWNCATFQSVCRRFGLSINKTYVSSEFFVGVK